MAKYKIVVNNIQNLELLLQQIFDEADALVNQTQNEINKISNSVDLADEDSSIDAKTKYSKAINDLLNTKQKGITTKLDLGKLMTEIYKYNGNATQALNEVKSETFSFNAVKNKLIKSLKESEQQQTYELNK